MLVKKIAVIATTVVSVLVTGYGSAAAAPPPGGEQGEREVRSGASAPFFSGMKASIFALPDILKMRKAPLPANGNEPRKQSMDHIGNVLERARSEKEISSERTVGDCIVGSIGSIRTVANEHGSANIDSVFKSPELTELYKKPWYDREAHLKIAQKEYEYWQKENERNATEGTRAAVKVSPQARVNIQMGVGGWLPRAEWYKGR